jgi:amino acid permease
MRDLASLFGSGLFFIPFIYVPFYLYIERGFSHHALVQNMLKIFTMLGGLFLIIYACTIPMDFTVLMPSRGAAKNYVPTSIFLVIVGIATMALPFYSKYIKFSNSNER